MTKRTDVILLIIFIILGLFLRFWFYKDGAITFGYDQARDAFSALEISRGDLKIQGPSASTPGLFHGVLYYYLIAPAYLLGQGNPYVANIWLSIVNILTVIPIYLLGRFLFSNKVGLLAAFFFAISLDAVQYANWMSNPAPAVFSGSLFYLGLAYFIFGKRKDIAAFICALGLGLSTQFEIFLGYLFAPLLISIIYFKVTPGFKQVLIFCLTYVLTTSTMILSYLKFGPTFIQGFGNLYSSGGDPFGAWREFSPTLLLYLNRFAEYFYRGLLPFNVNFAGFFGILVIVFLISWLRKEKQEKSKIIFLLFMLFSHVILVMFGGTSTPFINAGLEIIFLTIVAYFIVRLFLKNKLVISLLVLLITFSSLYAIFKYNPFGQTVFAVQRGLTLKNELAAVDYTYQSAAGKSFTINTVTSPLWINTVWAYLYNWYGKEKYGFVPSFHGRDQSGYLGSMPSYNNEEVIYLIIEPLAGIPVSFAEGTVGAEDVFSKVVEEKNFGGIVVQKRVFVKPKEEVQFIK